MTRLIVPFCLGLAILAACGTGPSPRAPAEEGDRVPHQSKDPHVVWLQEQYDHFFQMYEGRYSTHFIGIGEGTNPDPAQARTAAQILAIADCLRDIEASVQVAFSQYFEETDLGDGESRVYEDYESDVIIAARRHVKPEGEFIGEYTDEDGVTHRGRRRLDLSDEHARPGPDAAQCGRWRHLELALQVFRPRGSEPHD